ncbi:aspartate 1-decarboxylase [Caminibacter pacificus]|uniref:Aspartate 1-decarboxylase n=1 Tax=Caminibacter pacificus TaxID=1424653 RepID=A0AAJ4RBG8_9BACT|nr:aspartate 1-decarboxylase [Caminibacter pacificus]NPA87739.1 aspartate 1-decarboxylase [Campylobacterota bacterium]QCI29056.1 aspartate 1-decarboxylase [Caminibacter pacificus]ROR39126.1 L-aspartate 1-decarboxylase [Caminibacter pacificus]
MTIEMLYSKIHRATVTDANLNYVGSITIDEELMEEANLFVGQKVDIVNINNGERFSTYVIKGERGKRDICLNGAAARKVHPGDKIIIIAYANMTLEEAKKFKPAVVIVDDNNNVIEKTTYLQEG